MANINLSGTVHHELQSKVITERINLLETCMGNLCENFGKIARKNARLRDTSDHMVMVLTEYSGKEQINSSSKKGLVNYSSYLSAVEDYRHAMIERVEKKIIQPLSKYQEYLKSSRKTIKSTIQIRDNEKKKQQKLNQLMQRQPDNGRNIAQAEANAENASFKVAAQDKMLADEIDKLEQKKLIDMRNILKEYTHIQLIFHAKALEMLTIAYKQLNDIDTDADLEEFRNNFTQSNLPSYQGSRHTVNDSTKNSYDNLFTGGSMPNISSKSNRKAKSNENLNKSSTNINKENEKTIQQQQKNTKMYNSAPNLNNNKKKRDEEDDDDDDHYNDDDDDDEELEVEDLTDDSDNE